MRPYEPTRVCAPLETARLRLAPTAPEHAEAMFAVLSDERIYTFLEGGPPESVERLAARYARASSRCSPDGRQGWFEWVVAHEGEALGYVQATVDGDHDETAIAYVLAPSAWGRGFATEACRAVMDHLVQALGPHRFAIHVDAGNVASQRLAERLGFVRVAVLPGVNHLRSGVSDDYRYVLG